jgi:hypothetical protein
MSNDVHQPQYISYSIFIFPILLVYLLNLLGAVYILFSFASRHFPLQIANFSWATGTNSRGSFPSSSPGIKPALILSPRLEFVIINLPSSMCTDHSVCVGKTTSTISISEASLFHRTAPVFNSLILPTPLGEAPEGVIPALPPRSNSFGPTGASTCVEAALGSLDLHSNFQVNIRLSF